MTGAHRNIVSSLSSPTSLSTAQQRHVTTAQQCPAVTLTTTPTRPSTVQPWPCLHPTTNRPAGQHLPNITGHTATATAQLQSQLNSTASTPPRLEQITAATAQQLQHSTTLQLQSQQIERTRMNQHQLQPANHRHHERPPTENKTDTNQHQTPWGDLPRHKHAEPSASSENIMTTARPQHTERQ